MIPFIFLTVFVLIFAYLAERYDSISFFGVCLMLLTFFSAFRGESVGIDTAQYYRVYNDVASGKNIYGIEKSFLMFCDCLQYFSKKPEFLVFLMSALTNVLILFRFWSFRKEASFLVMIAIYIAGYYPETMNVMRQFLAVAIVFAGSYFLFRKQILIYALFLIIAVIFHKSALLGLGLIVVYLLTEKELKSHYRILSIIVLLISLVVLLPVIMDSLEIYSRYFNRLKGSVGFMIPFKLCCFMLAVLLAKFGLRKEKGVALGVEKINLNNTGLYLLGLLTCCGGMFFLFMDRIALYYMMFEMPFWGRLAKSNYFPLFYMTQIAFFVAYLYVMYLFSDGHRIFPYYTVFGGL